ncbi:MAG TPA: aldo/keto reductase [Caulobacteraceae bacterium]|jgi:diketogulonate reductase-like aldo/keto reductase|nr:aldo/keto reductase [Caulobacteraceae bacterium]
MKTVTVAGVTIPALGFGTWQLEGQAARRMTQAALNIGYRHIDTAAAYGNEREVGEAIRACGVDRNEIFVTTKIWNDAHRNGELQRAAEASLRRLGLDHVDLLLLHWPVPSVPLAETIGALNDTLERGLTRAIGVSNFTVELIVEAARLSKAQLATDQVEYHPYLNQQKILEIARSQAMTVTAYSPLGHGRVLNDPVLGEIAAAHGKSVSQVILRWLMQQVDVLAVPKTANEDRARENFEAQSFDLSEHEMARIFALAREDGRVIDPGFAPDWDD